MSPRVAGGFAILVSILISIGPGGPASHAAEVSHTSELTLASCMYVGWMPWHLAAEDGTLQRYAGEQGHTIRFVSGDYLETISQFASGEIDAVTITNIDALAFLSAKGIPADAILISSYSQGNDAILLRSEAGGDITRGPLGLAQFSVSHYLLDRYLDRQRIESDQVELRNIGDTEIAAAFADPSSDLMGIATWQPMVRRVERRLNVDRVFDSRMIEGEIADMLIVRRTVAREHPDFAQALLAAWFDVMARMRGPGRYDVLADLGRLSGTDGAEYEQQLTTTMLIKTPEVGLGYLLDPNIKTVMVEVRAFVDRNLFATTPQPAPWVSYGADPPGLLHFDERPLQSFMDISQD